MWIWTAESTGLPTVSANVHPCTRTRVKKEKWQYHTIPPEVSKTTRANRWEWDDNVENETLQYVNDDVNAANTEGTSHE